MLENGRLTQNTYVVKCLRFHACFLSYLIWGSFSMKVWLSKFYMRERHVLVCEGEGASSALGVPAWHWDRSWSWWDTGVCVLGTENGTQRKRSSSCHHLIVLCSVHWSTLLSFMASVVIDGFKASRSFIGNSESLLCCVERGGSVRQECSASMCNCCWVLAYYLCLFLGIPCSVMDLLAGALFSKGLSLCRGGDWLLPHCYQFYLHALLHYLCYVS